MNISGISTSVLKNWSELNCKLITWTMSFKSSLRNDGIRPKRHESLLFWISQASKCQDMLIFIFCWITLCSPATHSVLKFLLASSFSLHSIIAYFVALSSQPVEAFGFFWRISSRAGLCRFPLCLTEALRKRKWEIVGLKRAYNTFSSFQFLNCAGGSRRALCPRMGPWWCNL